MTQLMPSYDGNKKCNIFEHVSGVSSKMADHIIIRTYFQLQRRPEEFEPLAVVGC
jgi:hypothetical protein